MGVRSFPLPRSRNGPRLQLLPKHPTPATPPPFLGKAKRDRLSLRERLLAFTKRNIGSSIKSNKHSDYRDTIMRYIADHRVKLGIDRWSLRLKPSATLINADLAFFKFDVYRDDLLVEDASLSFRFKQKSWCRF